MKNKGFSIIELIIVIAIVAALALLLVPALIRYVNKSRLDADMDTAGNLADAMVAVVVSNSAVDSAVDHATPHKVKEIDGQEFRDAVSAIVPLDELEGYTKKDLTGNPLPDPQFYYTLDAEKNKVEIYYGGTTPDYRIYPDAGSKLIE